MRKIIIIRFITGFFVLLTLSTCKNITLPEVDRRLTYAIRIFPEPENGHLRLSEAKVIADSYITIYANPDPGFELTTIVLQMESQANANPTSVNTPGPGYSTQITSHTAVTAIFSPITRANVYSVSVDPFVENGLIYPERVTYSQAQMNDPSNPLTALRINIIPQSGFDLVEGSLKVKRSGGGEISISSTLPYVFNLPDPGENLFIEGQFEWLDPSDLKERASRYLRGGLYDTAAELYESAYQREKKDPELILYSTLGLLGDLLIDPDVRAIMGYGSLYFSPVPSTIEGWVGDDLYIASGGDLWYKEYAPTVYTPKAANLPKFYNRFSGFIKPFGDSPIAQEPGPENIFLFTTDKGLRKDTREKFSSYIFWAMISSYRSGFNPFVDKVSRYVFGKKFDEALARAESFPENERVLLNSRLKDQFSLEDVYGSGDTYIGKPELDYIFANLLAVKAAFEFLSSYDLTIDLRNWLMDYIYWDHGLDEILNQMFSLLNHPNHKPLWQDPATVAKMLPLKNNFLTIREAGAMTRAKSTITKAAAKGVSSVNYWFGDSAGQTTKFSPTAKDERRWIEQAWKQAKEALEGVNGGIFYYPRLLPRSEPGSYWPDGSSGDYYPDPLWDGRFVNGIEVGKNKIFGVNTAKLFTPGTFTPTNLFTTEINGRAPKMFRIEWYAPPPNYNVVTFTGNSFPVTAPIVGLGNETNSFGVAGYGIYSFEVNTKNLKEIFPKGFGTLGDATDDKAFMHEVFPSIPIWPWGTTYFKGYQNSAAKLYEYYHKTTVD